MEFISNFINLNHSNQTKLNTIIMHVLKPNKSVLILINDKMGFDLKRERSYHQDQDRKCSIYKSKRRQFFE